MKKQLFLTLIAILTLTSKASCSQKPSDAKENKARAKQNNQQPRTTVTVHVPEALGKPEELNLDQQAIGTLHTFQKHVERHQKIGAALLIARIVTNNDEADADESPFNISYYTAHSIVQKYFGSYPLNITHESRALYDKGYRKNLFDGSPITHGILFFSLDSQNSQKGCTYLCDHAQLLGDNDVWRQQFYANQDDNSDLKREALNALIGQGIACWNNRKYKQAQQHFAPVAAQNTFLDLKTSGLNELGDTYGALGDHKTAFEYYTMAAQYTQEQAGKKAYIQTKFNLGTYYFNGTATEVNYKLARPLLEAAFAQKQELTVSHQTHLAFHLGCIELEEGHYKKAEPYFQLAARQIENRSVREKALKKLEDIKRILAQATEQKESKQKTKQPEQTTGTTTSSTAPATTSAITITAAATVAASSSSTVTSTASASTTAATEQSIGSPAVALA